MIKLQTGTIMLYKRALHALIIMLSTCSLIGCQYLSPIIYEPEIKQGKSLSNEVIAQLVIGMNKDQVIAIMGTPTITNTFNTNEWAYLRTVKKTHQKIEKYKTVVLKFDKNDHLLKIS